MKEEWKYVPALSINRHIGYFEASSTGRIRNCETGRILKTEKSTNLGIEIALLPLKQKRPVHQLVLHAFKGLKPQDNNKYRAEHLDGNFLNNASENLDWIKIEGG
tara:strand:+ start:2972 stop:3286 length:315 start_codon:yes stop_codon:yes gene_type:complete